MIKNIKVFVFVGCLAIAFLGCTKEAALVQKYNANIEKVLGHHLFLDNGSEVVLVGVYIPLPWDVNYMPELQNYIVKLLEGKNVEVETVIQKHQSGIPGTDYVKIYFDGVNLNEQLLKTGKAFFSEDYWDKEEKKAYREYSDNARKKGRGVWAQVDKLSVLAVRRENWQYTHASDCKHVKGIEQNALIKYYTPITFNEASIGRDTFCEESMSIWRKEEALKNMRKRKYFENYEISITEKAVPLE